MKATTLASIERYFRKPITAYLPSKFVISKYSKERQDFLKKLEEDIPKESYIPPESLSCDLWGIKFRSPIINAAGMFKNGECYETVYRQGAGGFLGGTGTWNSREGNIWINPKNKNDIIYLPFTPYPRSNSSSNWLGLPNNGDEANSIKIKNFKRIEGFPIGWSVASSPDKKEEEKLECLVKGMKNFDDARIDWLEINGRCPNTVHDDEYDKLEIMLEYVSDNFLMKRKRHLPVVVKFSNDTRLEDVPYILDLLFDLRFDGVNFGNTSQNYEKHREKIHSKERKLYDFFTKSIGGAISGEPLKEDSLALCKTAINYKRKRGSVQEFHVIRTGGIETIKDIQESERVRISLNQWYTGYFENFSKHGHSIYKWLFKNFK